MVTGYDLGDGVAILPLIIFALAPNPRLPSFGTLRLTRPNQSKLIIFTEASSDYISKHQKVEGFQRVAFHF
jgi:hypothetical protein